MKDNKIQSRREFFKSAAKKALPILGAIALTQLPFVAKSHESKVTSYCDYGCKYGCDSTCLTGCQHRCGGCDYNCSGGCDGSCVGGCQTGCGGGCDGTCYTGCGSGAYL